LTFSSCEQLKYVHALVHTKIISYLTLIDCVATSPVVLRWLYDSPWTGCARRTKIYVCGANKQ